MQAYRYFTAAAIFVSVAELGACSSSNTPGSSNMGAGPAATCHVAGTLTVTNQGMTAYLIDGAANPALTLCRGSTYIFAINATGHPFYVKTVQSTGATDAYDTGVTGNGMDTGNVTFVVDSTAPNTLFYDCSIHAVMTGEIFVIN